MNKIIALSGLLLILLNVTESASLVQQRHESAVAATSANVSGTSHRKKNIFMPLVVPSKMRIIEHILSSTITDKDAAAAAAEKTSEKSAEREERDGARRQYLDDLVTLMSSMLMRMVKTATEQEQKEKDATTVHRVQSHRVKTGKSAQRQIAETVLNACEAHMKAIDDVNQWHCELNDEFNSLDLQSEVNFCSCSRSYECAESEQYSLDEIDMDDEELLNNEENQAAVVARCENAMSEATGESWNCTLSSDGYGPHGESNMFCECQTKKMCDFQKILYISELLKQAN